VQVIDLSRGGALLEAAHPFRPGANVEVQFERDDQRVRLAARVLRCVVFAVHPERGLTYRAALAFNQACELVRETRTRGGYDIPNTGGVFRVRGQKGSK